MMKSKKITIVLIISSAMLLIGGTIAFAYDGWSEKGPGRHHGGYHGHMRGDGHGWGRGGPRYSKDLSEEEIAKVEEVKEQFHKETRELRSKIKKTRIDLEDEMAKDEPDKDTLLKIQKNLSKLKAEFDQKAILYHVEMRKLLPEKSRRGDCGRGYRHGYGHGHGGYRR